MIKLYYFLFHKRILRKLYQFLESPIDSNIKKHNKKCNYYSCVILALLHSYGYLNDSDYFSIDYYIAYRRRAHFACWCGTCNADCLNEKLRVRGLL